MDDNISKLQVKLSLYIYPILWQSCVKWLILVIYFVRNVDEMIDLNASF